MKFFLRPRDEARGGGMRGYAWAGVEASAFKTLSNGAPIFSAATSGVAL